MQLNSEVIVSGGKDEKIKFWSLIDGSLVY
jgi:hypothetical protein